MSYTATEQTSHGAGDDASAVIRVDLPERFDAVAAIQVRTEFDALLATGASNMVTDLSNVEFIDSAGLAALVRVMQQLRLRGGDLVLGGEASPVVRRVMELTKFDDVFTMDPTATSEAVTTDDASTS